MEESLENIKHVGNEYSLKKFYNISWSSEWTIWIKDIKFITHLLPLKATYNLYKITFETQLIAFSNYFVNSISTQDIKGYSIAEPKMEILKMSTYLIDILSPKMKSFGISISCRWKSLLMRGNDISFLRLFIFEVTILHTNSYISFRVVFFLDQDFFLNEIF